MTSSHTPSNVSNTTVTRRQALKIGGLTASLAALAAACGDGRTGDATPGRVGNAPKVEALPEYEINDAVLLRTASSLENTAVFTYETALGLGVLDDDMTTLVERLIENHTATAAEMGELTEAAGGVAWTDTNSWYMDRSIEPMLATIVESDDPARDVANLAITLENMASATHQTLAGVLSESEQRLAVVHAAAQEARHSAALVLAAYGTGRRYSPELVGEEVVNADGLINRYAIESPFGSVAQQELNLGEADVNGTRTGYLLATPAANSYVYEEPTES